MTDSTRQQFGRRSFGRYEKKLWRKNPRCTYCKTVLRWKETTVDHVVPTIKGGDDSEENLVLACKSCNGRKSGKSHEEFIEDLKGN